MESNIKTNLLENLHDQVIKRKAMFIPMLCITTFGLVGYAAVDKEAPVIEAKKIEVLYGTKLDKTMFAISDNRDSLDALDVQFNDKSYDPNQLGIYNVEVTATDLFSNSSEPTIVQVEVVDKTAPELTPVGKNSGYVVDVEINGSNDITQYIHATDNVDGDVTPFIEASATLDTTKMGTQAINLTVSDNAGNTRSRTYEFFVSDTTAPVFNYVNGENVTVDYGSNFDYTQFLKITDNFDTTVTDIKIDGTVDTKKLESKTLNITAVDSAGNESKGVLNTVVKDISGANINLSKSSVTITTGNSFDAKSYLKGAVDNKDGDITSKVQISSSVNTGKAGKYSVTYSVTDSSGNSSSKTLNVTVENPIPSNAGVAATALSRVGCRYVYGASGPNKFDCSGLTMWAYRQNGISIPRTSGGQFSASKRIAKSELKTGDLVFFKGTTGGSGISHVGIYIGGGNFVHAPSSGKTVTVDSLNSSYYSRHWAGGGRF